jgi:two-component system sensor histidine kinase BaeS
MQRMKLGITSKLFLAILATCIVVAVAMSVAVRISFQWGFLGYVNELERQRLANLSTVLADGYGDQGNWHFLQGNEAEWRRLFGSVERALRRPADPDAWQRRPPPAEALRREPMRLVSGRLSVLDADRRVVVGNPEPPADAVERPILVNGRTVGYLVAGRLRRLTSAADLEFQEQQMKASWVIGALAVLLAAGVAVWLARTFLAPTRRLAQATHRLAAGDYATRVPVSSADELGRLAEDFNRLASTLERNEQMRRNFMADVSHELRTPLAVMRGELEAMEDGLQPLNRQSLQSLRAEVATLTKLVGDIYELSLADVGALTYRLTDVDAAEVLERVLAGYRERLAARGIAVGLDVPVTTGTGIQGDPERLTQLFNNILENSVRYTQENGRVQLRCETVGPNLRIEVHDSGPGVPAELLPRLFERFYRMESSRNRATGGAGLGLAICRSIVQAHGGTIQALASDLGGLCLRIELPRTGSKEGEA